MKSIRRTALTWIAAVLLPMGIAGTTVAYLAGRDESNFVFDGLIAQIALHLAPGIYDAAPWPTFDDPEDEVVIQVWDAEGHSIRDSDKVRIPRQTVSGFVDQTIDGEPWRTFVAHSGGHTVQVSHRQEVRDEVAEQLAMSAALPILVALPVVWALVALALSRLFGQLDQTSEAVAGRSVETTDPLPLEGIPAEMTSFVLAMNQLLKRQADAIEQQRRFVSDAAHELRTPLTALQILVDTLAQRISRGASASDNELAGDLTRAVNRARALVNQLLKLAEIDARRESAMAAAVDLRAALLDAIAGLVPAASSKEIEFAVTAEETAEVLVSPMDLSALLSILVDNAVRYSPPRTAIDARLDVTGRQATIEICDRGAGITPDALPRVYDRFFRASSQDVEGSGLGLSIAKAIADRYGFSLRIANRAGGGVSVTVIFPALTRDDRRV